jgi:hypothetical protein
LRTWENYESVEKQDSYDTEVYMRPRALTLAVAGLSIAAAALPASSMGEGATVTKGADCTIQVPGFPSVTTTKQHSVQTNSQNNNSNENCHAELPAGAAPDRGLPLPILCVTATGGPIGTGHLVITPSGKVNLTCHFKN